MIEDSLVDLIYGYLYGWRILVYALITASIIMVGVTAFSTNYALTYLLLYINLISKFAAVILAGIGLFWLGSSLLRKGNDELDEIKQQRGRTKLTLYLIALQFVLVEELEIVLVIIPLVITFHAIEASLAATVGIAVSVSTAALLRKNFEGFIAGKFRYLKIVSGVFLTILGIALFLEI